MQEAALIQYLKLQAMVDYLYISGAALLVYNYITTLHLEVALIWRSRWTYTKILFFMARYMPFVQVCLMTYHQLAPGYTLKECTATYTATTGLLVIGINVTEIVLAIRTWAIWQRDKIIGVILALVLIASWIAEIIVSVQFVRSLKFAAAPYPQFKGCFTVGGSKIAVADWITLCVVESILLVLIATSAFRAYRSGERNKLLHVIHRDGIMSYVYLLCLTVGNVVIIFTTSNVFLGVLSSLEDVLYSVLTAQIMFNIRTVGQDAEVRGNEIELHTDTYICFASIPGGHLQDSAGEMQLSNRGIV